jgi:hypothetical protein
MKWKTKTFEELYNECKDWHVVFAWLPCRLKDGSVVWLNIVKRRATPVSLEDHGGMVYEYDHAVVPGP